MAVLRFADLLCPAARFGAVRFCFARAAGEFAAAKGMPRSTTF
jgi:hypothetical protein